MASLYKGTVVPVPFFNYTKSGKAMLKFKVRLTDDPNKRISVVVWGDQAENNSDLEPGEQVMVSGKWKENEFNGETSNELHLGDYGGNLKRSGEKKAVVHSQGGGFRETSPQRRKSHEEQTFERYFAGGDMPHIDDPPEGFGGGPAPSDDDYADIYDFLCTEYSLAIGVLNDPADSQQSFCW